MKKLNTVTKLRTCFVSIFLLTFIFFQTPKSYSQTWSDVGGGMCDWLNASVVYNGELVVGGRFKCANGVYANYIAKWNGSSWDSLGSGTNGWVWALTVYNGELFAGGQFDTAGGVQANNIARWDGNSWTDVSGGTNSIVASLTVYNGQLIAGGYFTDAEGIPVNNIGAWDNSGWHTLGTGMSAQVMAVNVYGTDLIAAGFFTTAGGLSARHIAKWNGASWDSVGTGIEWITYSLGQYKGDLIAGGLFSHAGGVSAKSIAKWNGSSWSALGSGMSATPVGYDYVFALAEYNGSLFAGGMYDSAGGVMAKSIAKWDGISWTALNGGVDYGGSNVYAVNTLTVYNSDLYAGGIFTSAGGVGVAHIARYSETLTSIRNDKNQDELLHLYNYPNPFKQSVSISYDLLKAGNVQMTVFDATGREVKTLINEYELPGAYTKEFNTSEFTSGMYFLKLNTENKNQIIKLIKN